MLQWLVGVLHGAARASRLRALRTAGGLSTRLRCCDEARSTALLQGCGTTMARDGDEDEDERRYEPCDSNDDCEGECKFCYVDEDGEGHCELCYTSGGAT